MAMVRVLASNSAMSSSRVSGMAVSFALEPSGLASVQLLGQPLREGGEDRRFLAVAGGGRAAGIGILPDREGERDAAEEGDGHHLRRRFRAAGAERVRDLAAMRAFVAGHVLD